MNRLILLLVVAVFASCKTTKNNTEEYIIEETMLDTMTVAAPVYDKEEAIPTLDVYNPSAKRRYDILHTGIKVSFDWEKELVIGIADIMLTPMFYPIDEVVLDAQQFIINSVTLTDGKELQYTYDDNQLTVTLDKTYTRGESLEISVDYIAQPSSASDGGSAAITSDKGLFFINPRGEEPGKPRQIWTQGETENNSRWFPTFDKPNERMTQEIWITVNDTLQTLSNGLLVSSEKHSNGTRTDYWKQDLPHAPYLTMIAVGTFATATEKLGDLSLTYYVDPPYEADAKLIFEHTPEMITFFSDMLGTPFPWAKYDQIVVEDFVSGAMENTTASVFGDFVQKHARELIDNDNDDIVAHELFHQWFGNLVTTESWANLTLNEGFANYSEYLWREYKDGKRMAESHRLDEMSTYIYTTQAMGTHPLIYYGYNDKEDMFDAHSYNKGGLVLHMLRNIVGEEAFFTSLTKYLEDNKYTAVEVDELRMAFEDTLGEDMNWFFDQWFHDAGHPIINVNYHYDEANDMLMVNYEQIQDKGSHKEIFILPTDVAIYDAEGKISYHPVTIDKRKGTLGIKHISEEPILAKLDGKSYLLAEINEEMNTEEYVAQLRYSPHFIDRVKAIKVLDKNTISKYTDILLTDEHPGIRMEAMDAATTQKDMDKIESMILQDPHSEVRALALILTRRNSFERGYSYAEKVINTEEGLTPLSPALMILNEKEPEKAQKYALDFMDEDPVMFLPFVSEFLLYQGKEKYLNYYEDNILQIGVDKLFDVFSDYKSLLLEQDDSLQYEKANLLADMAYNDTSIYRRFLAAQTINAVKENLIDNNDGSMTDNANKLDILLKDIIAKEKDANLKMRYAQF